MAPKTSKPVLEHPQKCCQQVAVAIFTATPSQPSSEMPQLPPQQSGAAKWKRWGVLILLFSITMLYTATRARPSSGLHQLQTHRYLRQSTALPSVEPASSTLSRHKRRQLNIFGSDERREVLDPSVYPYSAVGLLRWNDDVTCTGSLVAETLVLTAAECVLEPDGSIRASSSRKPQFLVVQSGGGAVRKGWVTRVHKQSSYWTKWTRNTYVLLELDTALGATHGVLHLPKSSDFSQRTTGSMYVQMVSYVDAEAAEMVYETCTMYFPGEFDGPQYMVHHDCDMGSKPAPGSPMVVRSTSLEAFIVGIHSNAVGGSGPRESDDSVTYSRFDDDVANRGVLASFIQRHLEFLHDQTSSSLASTSSLDVEGSSSTMIDPSTASSGSTPESASTTLESDAQEEQSNSTAASSSSSAALEQQTASEATSQALTDAMAYSCIGLVGIAWVAIIFIAVRSTRSARTTA